MNDEEFISKRTYHVYIYKNKGLYSLAANVLPESKKNPRKPVNIVELEIDQITGKVKVIYQKIES